MSLKQDAEQGDAEAQCNLGNAYATGNGVSKNDVEAVKWWRKAAEQGYADAQFNLGNAYHTGDGVEQDDVEAVKWWRLSADQGNADAQYGLRKAYSIGEGVPKNYVEAYAWYNIAAVTVDDAKKARSKFEKSMSQSDIARAQYLSTELSESIRLKRRP